MLHPEVVAELEAASAARNKRKDELSATHRVNALEARLYRLELAPRPNSAPSLDEDFWSEVTAAFRGFVEGHVNKLKAENAALAAKVARLEVALAEKVPIKYLGVYRAGATYSEGSMVTRDGSMYHANKTTREAPGDGCQDWQLCVKHGRDGKDAKT
jgi:hypothetical protein